MAATGSHTRGADDGAAKAQEKSASKKNKSPPRETRLDTSDVSPQGPGNENPNWVLPLWSDGPTVEWRAEGYLLGSRAEQLIAQAEAKADAPSKANLARLGQAHVLLLQLDRRAERLLLFAEPAGHDLLARHEQLRHWHRAVKKKLAANHREWILSVQEEVANRCRNLDKNLLPIRKLYEAQKFDEAEQRLLPLYDELAVGGMWCEENEGAGPLFPVERLRLTIDRALYPIRRQQGREAIQQRRTQETPQYAELLAEIDAAAAALAAGQPTVEAAGQPLDGPALAGHFLARWLALNIQTLHLRALDGALAEVAKDHRTESSEVIDDPRSQVAFKKFCGDATGALVKLIEADAAHLSPEAAADRYQAYLDALAPAMSLAADPALVEQVQAALDRVAAISPPLVEQIASYRSATGQLLRWRRAWREPKPPERIRPEPPCSASSDRSPSRFPNSCRSCGRNSRTARSWPSTSSDRGGKAWPRVHPTWPTPIGSACPLSRLRRIMSVCGRHCCATIGRGRLR